MSATDGAMCPQGCGPFGVTTFDHSRGREFPLRHLVCVCCGDGWAATDDDLRDAVEGEHAYDVQEGGNVEAAGEYRAEKLRRLGLA